MAEEKKKCFIIMPITTPETFQPKYSDGIHHFTHVLECLFIPAIQEAGMELIPPIAKGSDLIPAEIIKNLETSDLVLCDMSTLNPNVFFEYGIRTALNKPVCAVKDEFTEKVPFDTSIINYKEYQSTLKSWEIKTEIEILSKHIKESFKRSKNENTLWKYFGMKTEGKPSDFDDSLDSKIEYQTLVLENLERTINKKYFKEDISNRKDDLDEKIIMYINDYLIKRNLKGRLFTWSYSPDNLRLTIEGYEGTRIPEFEKRDLVKRVKYYFDVELIL